MKEEFELIAKTFQGLEEVLAKELTELGASATKLKTQLTMAKQHFSSGKTYFGI